MTGLAGASSLLLARSERAAGLVFLPILCTISFYLAPRPIGDNLVVQFLPQALSYLGLIVWGRLNGQVSQRLGLGIDRLASGLAWGTVVGMILGAINVIVILKAAPRLGYDITFLTQTPHARVPFWLMIPWFILAIAILVELNFRGFILGRLLALSVPPSLAVLLSALLFAFDPFMVATFRYLHWIAVWDGIVWGMMWLRLRSLYAVIAAHAVEVIIMYWVVRAVLN
jgi:membrane protease YdiL (CAAX protease family)